MFVQLLASEGSNSLISLLLEFVTLLCILIFYEWISYGIAAIAPFSHRLTFDNMPKYLQHLRCKVNFQALAFVPHIRQLGDALITRLRFPPSEDNMVSNNYLREVTDLKPKQGVGKFAVLHLRFDKVKTPYCC